jgi:hypothetical protein
MNFENITGCPLHTPPHSMLGNIDLVQPAAFTQTLKLASPVRIFYAAAGGICPQSRMGYASLARYCLKWIDCGARAGAGLIPGR